jgi:hypothetical protein
MSKRYPWYDSGWITRYVRAKELIRRVRPDKLPDFVQTFECLRTRPDFQVREFSRVVDDATMREMRGAVRTLPVAQLKIHEVRNFGRFVVHDLPFFTELQQSLTGFVSEAAGETVESHYNFLSIYTRLGVCPVHMDAPKAKWTLDLCIDQSEPWPIHLSQVLPWPEQFACEGDDWQESIKRAPEHRFTPYSLEPGKALLFSGSSQWHYRDALPATGKDHFCHLVFFHFVPKGMREKVEPKNWPDLFGIPELADVL